MSTVAADDQTTHEIRWSPRRVEKDIPKEVILEHYQPHKPYVPKRAMPEHHWLLRWTIEVAAVTIALTMTTAMTVFAYPVLTEMIGSWGIIVSTIVGLGFGIVVTWCALQLVGR